MSLEANGGAPTIDHVVVLALENRSFDHLLGYLDHPDSRYEGLRKATKSGNRIGKRWIAATDDGRHVLTASPDHSHVGVMDQLRFRGVGKHRAPTNGGFAQSFEIKASKGHMPPVYAGLLAPIAKRLARRKVLKKLAGSGQGPLIMRCLSPDKAPVLSQLALQFGVCDHWFCSVPGETWPNRNFMHAGTSDGTVNIDLRAFSDRTIFELLADECREDHFIPWCVYFDDVPQVAAFTRLWLSEKGNRINQDQWRNIDLFAEDVRRNRLARYSFIEPNHNAGAHLPGRFLTDRKLASNSQHPNNNLVNADAQGEFERETYSDPCYENCEGCDFWRGERLIARVYESLRAHPELFAKTLLLITYDEHGGYFDHLPPPTDVPPPGERPMERRRLSLRERILREEPSAPFAFNVLGPRVPAVVISPLIPAGSLDQDERDHSSIPATLRAIFAPTAGALSKRDAWAPPFHTKLATLTQPRTDLPDLSKQANTKIKGERDGAWLNTFLRGDGIGFPPLYINRPQPDLLDHGDLPQVQNIDPPPVLPPEMEHIDEGLMEVAAWIARADAPPALQETTAAKDFKRFPIEPI